MPLRGPNERAALKVARKYSYLASWSNWRQGKGWKDARWRFVLSLVVTQIQRRSGAMLVWDFED